MTAAPPQSSFRSHSLTRVNNTGRTVKYLTKSNVDFRDASRREDAQLIFAAFDGRTQSEIAQKGSRALGVSERQIINWMQLENDMPSWAVKAVKWYIRTVEGTASRIEGPK